MARYRSNIQGARGSASRLGHKTSGISACVNGWHLGVDVTASYNAETDCDVFRVYVNGGSNRGTPEYNIREIRNAEGILTGFEISEKPAEIESEDKNEYRYICGVCGFKYHARPRACHCGNDAEFEPIK